MFPPKEANESGGGWRNHAPAIGVAAFVVVSHFIWRGFQETEVFEGRGAKFPHSEFPNLLSFMGRWCGWQMGICDEPFRNDPMYRKTDD